ncbi:MAG: ABC transporter ATP-binding protein, partial [Anaerolineales bacterium]|nr:ABC transporter ATP-binding protein [Anaerolineales bacterium]
MSNSDYEEEDFSAQFNGRTVLRILAQTRPHWKWVVGFLVTVALVSFQDAYFTYLGKRIVDEGIGAGDLAALSRIVLTYASMLLVQAVGVFTFIYLAGVLGER